MHCLGHATEGGLSFYVWMFVLTAISLVGANAWAHQVAEGMIVTNMTDHVSWGLYIANFPFCVGLAAGGVMMVIAAPMGATSVLVFGVPHSPLAQPRNVIGGDFIGAFVSIVLVQSFGMAPWVMATAVATTIVLMKLTRTVNPPSGAVALVGVMSGVSWDFLFTPVLAGSIVIVLWTYVFNNLSPGRSYPEHWL